MIILTRLDKSRILVNLDIVKYIESMPDTLVFFQNGDSLIVQESLEEIERRVLDYKTRILNLAAMQTNPKSQ
jgi:flagellar protein FlbD